MHLDLFEYPLKADVINAGSSLSFLMKAPWSTGTECVAKYNFQTANEQDLPFCKGDVLTIIGVTRVRKQAAQHTTPNNAHYTK